MGTKDDKKLPPGYRLVPLDEKTSYCPLTLCLIVRDGGEETKSPEGRRLIELRDLSDAVVYLGALADWENNAHTLVEIWFQSVDGFANHYPDSQEATSNEDLDHRWANRVKAFSELGASDLFITGWEDEHPDPLFLDGSLSERIELPNGDGEEWQLCRDDRLLKSCGLPAYAATMHRYLGNGKQGEEARFVPVTKDAPENKQTIPIAKQFPNLKGVNPEGGLMMVRKFYPLALEEFIDQLGGSGWKGIERLDFAFKPAGIYEELADVYGLRHARKGFLLGHLGVEGQMLEVLHLKVRLLLDLFQLVRGFVKATQAPFLNLSPRNFGVEFGEVSSGLPFMWAFRAGLKEPGEALASTIETVDGERFYLAASYPTGSVYRAGELSLVLEGEGTVRIRRNLQENDDKELTILEGTLVTDETVRPARKDLLKIRLNLGTERLELYGQFVPSAAGAHGEYRFRTFPHKIDDAAMAYFESEEGVSTFPSTGFTVIPVLGPPCDLFSMAVIAIRVLFTDGHTALPVLVDELMTLAGIFGEQEDRADSVGERLERVVAANNPDHWKGLIGPHRLVRDEIHPDTARACVPHALWWDLLGLALCLFPGKGEDSFCADFSDFNARAPEQTFDEPIKVLEAISARTSGLVTGDWVMNREIASGIQSVMRELEEETG